MAYIRIVTLHPGLYERRLYIDLPKNETTIDGVGDQEMDRLLRCYWCRLVKPSVSLVEILHYHCRLLSARLSVFVVIPPVLYTLTRLFECLGASLPTRIHHVRLRSGAPLP